MLVETGYKLCLVLVRQKIIENFGGMILIRFSHLKSCLKCIFLVLDSENNFNETEVKRDTY